MQFLKQKWSGRIYVRSDVLAHRKDMEIYEWPSKQTDNTSTPDLEFMTKDELELYEWPSDDTKEADLESMTKDELEVYASGTFGVAINKRKSQANLVKEINELRETE